MIWVYVIDTAEPMIIKAFREKDEVVETFRTYWLAYLQRHGTPDDIASAL